jgi:hypothetical protein
MLRLYPILRRIGAHLVRTKTFRKKIVLSKGFGA